MQKPRVRAGQRQRVFRKNLPVNAIHARNIHTPQRREQIAALADKPRRVVLIDMPGERHAVRVAPCPQRLEIILCKLVRAEAVKIHQRAALARVFRFSGYKRRQKIEHIIAELFAKAFIHARLARFHIHRRLIRKHCADRPAKARADEGRVFLVRLRDKLVRRFPQQKLGVFPLSAAGRRAIFGDPGFALRAEGNAQPFPVCRECGQRILRGDVGFPRGQRPRARLQLAAAKLRLRRSDMAARAAGGPAVLVVKPERHAALFGFFRRKGEQAQIFVRQVVRLEVRRHVHRTELLRFRDHIERFHADARHIVQPLRNPLARQPVVPDPGINRRGIIAGREEKLNIRVHNDAPFLPSMQVPLLFAKEGGLSVHKGINEFRRRGCKSNPFP